MNQTIEHEKLFQLTQTQIDRVNKIMRLFKNPPPNSRLDSIEASSYEFLLEKYNVIILQFWSDDRFSIRDKNEIEITNSALTHKLDEIIQAETKIHTPRPTAVDSKNKFESFTASLDKQANAKKLNAIHKQEDAELKIPLQRKVDLQNEARDYYFGKLGSRTENEYLEAMEFAKYLYHFAEQGNIEFFQAKNKKRFGKITQLQDEANKPKIRKAKLGQTRERKEPKIKLSREQTAMIAMGYSQLDIHNPAIVESFRARQNAALGFIATTTSESDSNSGEKPKFTFNKTKSSEQIFGQTSSNESDNSDKETN